MKDDGMRFVDDYTSVMIYIAFSELVEYQTISPTVMKSQSY